MRNVHGRPTRAHDVKRAAPRPPRAPPPLQSPPRRFLLLLLAQCLPARLAQKLSCIYCPTFLSYHDIIICPHVHHFGPHVPRHATPWLLWKSTATTSGNMNISSSSAEPAPEVSQNLSCVDCPRFLSCHQFIISYNCPHGIIFTHTIPPSPRVWSSATVRCPPWTACRNAALSRRSN